VSKTTEAAPAAEEPTAPVIQPVLYTMTQDQLQALLAAAGGSNAGGGITSADLKALLDSQRTENEERRSVRHSNADHTHVSVFSFPQGDLKQPKPKLTRETFFNNHREHEDELTPAEIEAFNAITHSRDARGGAWTAVVKNGRLLINVPSHTPDDRENLPSGLVLILKELAEGERAVTPVDMALRIADLERRLAAQETGVVLATA
jgi:hypothetical protein